MQEITGAKGPALVARSIFSKLERTHESLPLPVSASLIQRTICPLSGLLAEESCPHIDELFIKGTEPTAPCRGDHDSGGRTESETGAAILLPTPGLHLARDPRIPDSLEAFPFEVAAPSDTEEIHWIVDGEKVGTTRGDTRRLIWPLVAGAHEVRAQVVRKGSDASIETATVQFFVK
jgi:penicillin-binding protein 1C